MQARRLMIDRSCRFDPGLPLCAGAQMQVSLVNSYGGCDAPSAPIRV
jgi:hypothetical protein